MGRGKERQEERWKRREMREKGKSWMRIEKKGEKVKGEMEKR